MSSPKANAAPITNVNHIAYRCRDAEQTRWFYEDVLELPLRIAVSEPTIPGTDLQCPFMHLFFEMPNGDYVAFFDEPTRATPEFFAPADSFDRHLAFEVKSMDDVLAWQKKINERGVMCLGPVDHDFVKSVYFYDPNGLLCEVTTKDKGFDSFAKKQKSEARAHLDEWVAQTRAEKIEKFGADAIDARTVEFTVPEGPEAT